MSIFGENAVSGQVRWLVTGPVPTHWTNYTRPAGIWHSFVVKSHLPMYNHRTECGLDFIGVVFQAGPPQSWIPEKDICPKCKRAAVGRTIRKLTGKGKE